MRPSPHPHPLGPPLARAQDLRASPADDGTAAVGGMLPGRVDLDPYAVVALGDQVPPSPQFTRPLSRPLPLYPPPPSVRLAIARAGYPHPTNTNNG